MNNWIMTDMIVYFFSCMIIYNFATGLFKWLGILCLVFVMWHKGYLLNKQIEEQKEQ